ncbi:MAG: oligosaccharide flippase family protein [Polyangiaceae bacterium]|nr:oligosaccharide flippase family protein [Polyangiaceae bacterium]
MTYTFRICHEAHVDEDKAKVTEQEPRATAAPPKEDAAQTAGRGGLVIVLAKGLFILYGFAQQIVLQHLLGQVGYGEASLVTASVGVVNNVVVAASIQGVSRTVAAAPEGAWPQLYRRALTYHAVIAFIVSGLFAAAAGPISKTLNAEHVVTPMRLVALVVFLYGLYAPMVGALNGRKRFVDQGGLDIVYGAIRTVGIAGGAYLFMRMSKSGTLGLVTGFVASAAVIVPLAVWRAGVGKSGGSEPRIGPYLGFLFPVIVAQGCLNLLLRTDFFLLRYFAGAAARTANVEPSVADGLLGIYQGVQLYAFLPYQLLMSITFILFPMLSKAQAEGDKEFVKGFTRANVRLSFVFTGLICGTIASISTHVLRLASPEAIWKNGGEPLRILAIGMGTLSVLGISSAVLTSLKKEVAAAGVTIAAVAAVAAGCTVALVSAPLGEGMLTRTALAASAGLFAAMILSAVLVRKAAGGFVPVLTAVRVPAALAITVAVGSRMPWLGKALVIPQAAGMALVYILVLVVLREVGKDDVGMLLRVAGRKKR